MVCAGEDIDKFMTETGGDALDAVAYLENKEQLDRVLEELNRAASGLARNEAHEREEEVIRELLASGEPVIEDAHVNSIEGDQLAGHWDCHYVLDDDDGLSEMDWDSWDFES